MAKRNYTGKFIIRIEPGTHETLSKYAYDNTLSLNGVVKTILKEGAEKINKKKLAKSLVVS